MTRPRSQSQAARLQPRVLFTVLLQGSLWKRNSKLSFKIPEMDLLRQPSSALLLKKRREKKKRNGLNHSGRYVFPPTLLHSIWNVICGHFMDVWRWDHSFSQMFLDQRTTGQTLSGPGIPIYQHRS